MDTEAIKKEINELVGKMGFGEDLEGIEVHEGATSRISLRLKGRGTDEPVSDEDDPFFNQRLSPSSMLIGERGNNLLALDFLLKKILLKKYGLAEKFNIDINDYRIRRLEDLKQDVKAAAKEVRLYKKEVSLRPMSSFERRIVHLLLAEYPDITTESIGEEPNRMVIIKPFP